MSHTQRTSFVSLQLPATPMMVLPVRVKLPNVAAVQCSHDADAREHRRTARCRDKDQGFHGYLPFLGLMLGTGWIMPQGQKTDLTRNRWESKGLLAPRAGFYFFD